MTRFARHIRSNLVAYLALFVALGGTSYAALRLPAGSVGNRALKNHSITPIKFDRGAIAGYVRDWAKIDTVGRIVSSSPRAHLIRWNEQPGSSAPGGFVSWGEPIPRACFVLATTANLIPAPSYASAYVSSAGKQNDRDDGVYVRLSAPLTEVGLAVICPQP
jgi:hypothetical protein